MVKTCHGKICNHLNKFHSEVETKVYFYQKYETFRNITKTVI